MKLANHLLNVIKSLISSRERKLASAGAVIGILYILHSFQRKTASKYANLKKGKPNDRGSVNMRFLSNLWELIKVVVPSPASKEAFLLLLLSSLLVARTMLSISISSVNGGVVKSIVTRDFNSFLNRVLLI